MNRREWLGGAAALSMMGVATTSALAIAAKAEPMRVADAMEAEMLARYRVLPPEGKSAFVRLVYRVHAGMAVENGPLVQLAAVETWLLTPEEDKLHEAAEAAEVARLDAPMFTLATLPASSIAGLQAKARVLLGSMGRDPGPPAAGDAATMNDITRSLMRDLLRLTGAGA